jgi:hypothetical protein
MSDADWASCIRTRRSFTGSLIKLAGAAVAYKTQFQDTVATSSTESEFMAVYELGKALLYVRSILWDLDAPHSTSLCAQHPMGPRRSTGSRQPSI